MLPLVALLLFFCSWPLGRDPTFEMTDTRLQDVFRQTSVREDWIDLRDDDYAPNLSVLRDECYVDDRLLLTDPMGTKYLRFGLRNQGLSGRCSGFALANLIDLQRSLQFENRRKSPDQNSQAFDEARADHYARIVSADMLYRMAYFHDRYPDLETYDGGGHEGLRTLRSAIKGFYHHGVCYDWTGAADACPPGRWQSDCYLPPDAAGDVRLFPQVAQAKEARNIALGAYYRLASILNHFHAALNDAEAILVSANVHAGWNAPWDFQNDGCIAWSADQPKTGTHAFVIVGYDRDGFHVLNSVGPTWGGYKKQAGIGLWRYGDWARNIVDAWVLRLGVHAPDAFGASVGEKGVKGRYQVRGSTPAYELVGHYIHLDDGFHVGTGAYPSFKDGWQKTRAHLETNFETAPDDKRYKGVLVWIPGSMEDIKTAFGEAVKRKNRIKAMGLYPYTVFWCNGFAEKSMQVLTGLFKACQDQAGENAQHLDDLIEHRVRGVGRAFWRDIELSARRAVAGPTDLPYEKDEDDLTRFTPGFVVNFVKDLFEFVEESGAELHLVTEGAGVLLLHEILDLMEEDAQLPQEDRVFRSHKAEDLFSSVHLIGPAIGMVRAKKKLLPFLGRMNKAVSRRGGVRPENPDDIAPLENLHDPAPAKIFTPTRDMEDRLSFGAYNKSILHLVARAFEDRYAVPPTSEEEEAPPFGKPRTFLGMAKVEEELDEMSETCSLTAQARLGVTQITRMQAGLRDRIPQTVYDNNPAVPEYIFNSIEEMRKTHFDKED